MKKLEEFSTTEIIDNGKPFNWSDTSEDYARYRDIYPDNLFEKLHALDIGKPGQTVVDLGTGTGVIPRQLKRYGAKFFGVDISAGQIEQARRLSAGDDSLKWVVAQAENTGLPNSIADAVLACQCFIYFDKAKVIPEIVRLLKPGGIFAKISMIWLPFEDEIARHAEEMILKYNPDWTGAHHTRMPLQASEWSHNAFIPVALHTYDAMIPFTRESWRGRIRACRGMGASSLPDDIKNRFDSEFKEYLAVHQPEEFAVLHQVWIEAYTVKPEAA
jgi:SAM-dependent methyltransferase